MTDRRAEAFAVLDGLDRNNYDTELPSFYRGRVVRAEQLFAALRSVLERHHAGPQQEGVGAGKPPWCITCLEDSPCPDEQAAIDAVLGGRHD